MSDNPHQLTRTQLAEFLPNQRAIRAFEQLLKQVGDLLPNDIATLKQLVQDASLDASHGSAKAQEALDLLDAVIQDAAINAGAAESRVLQSLDRLSRALELLSNAPAAQENNSTLTDYIDFALTPRFAAQPGRVHWGPTGTLEIEMGGGNITQQVGEEFFVYGKATAAITEGQLIMVTGAVGASGVVTFAPTSTGLLDPNAILGIATENIALNGFGRVTTMGVVHGINTTGSSVGEVWADGDVLWYNTSAVGSMTKIKPVAPNMKTQVAIVINAGGGGSGSLLVEVINGSTLGGTDTNVQIGALADKQLLQYDAVAGYWKNVAASGIAEPPITAGTTAQYWMGNKTWQDFFTSVRAATLTGLSTATNAVITAADTVLSAFGKLQKQISANLTTLTTHTGATGTAVHGLGTMSTQNANAVAITGGAVDGVTIGATTAATIANVDNLRLDGNVLSSTNSDGNIGLQPNGTGIVDATGSYRTSKQLQFGTSGAISNAKFGSGTIGDTIQSFTFTFDATKTFAMAMVEVQFTAQQGFIAPGFAVNAKKWIFSLRRYSSAITATTLNSEADSSVVINNANYGITLIAAVTIVSATEARFDVTVTNSGALSVSGFDYVVQASVVSTQPITIT